MATAQNGGSGHGGGSIPSGNGGGGQYIGSSVGHRIGGGHSCLTTSDVKSGQSAMATAQNGGSGHGGGSIPSGNGGGGQYMGASSGHRIGGGHSCPTASDVKSGQSAMATAQKGGSGHGGGSMPSGNGGGGQYIGALSGHRIGGGQA